eukprot:scaffold156718_cov17-Tisochrysis_lutea.AAC.1
MVLPRLCAKESSLSVQCLWRISLAVHNDNTYCLQGMAVAVHIVKDGVVSSWFSCQYELVLMSSLRRARFEMVKDRFTMLLLPVKAAQLKQRKALWSCAFHPNASFCDPPADGPNIESAHQSAAASGQSAAPSENEEVMLHFVTFVHKD